MANSDASPVFLDENDVPGAILPHKTAEHCSVTNLKRWLKCRSLPVTGNKADLVKR